MISRIIFYPFDIQRNLKENKIKAKMNTENRLPQLKKGRRYSEGDDSVHNAELTTEVTTNSHLNPFTKNPQICVSLQTIRFNTTDARNDLPPIFPANKHSDSPFRHCRTRKRFNSINNLDNELGKIYRDLRNLPQPKDIYEQMRESKTEDYLIPVKI